MLRWAALAERREGRHEAAAALLQRGLDAVRAAASASLAGEHAQLLLALALVEQAQGDRRAAQQAFEQAQAVAGCDAHALCERLDDPRKGQTRAAWLAQQGEQSLALDLLEATLESRFWQADLLSTPEVAVLAAEPRLQPLQARLQQRLQRALEDADGARFRVAPGPALALRQRRGIGWAWPAVCSRRQAGRVHADSGPGG
jgi:tetratricopeptide (TPR) repeat protein